MDSRGDLYTYPRKLTANTFWPISSSTFKACRCDENDSKEHNNAVQTLVPAAFFQAQLQPDDVLCEIPATGAVIFGGTGDSRWYNEAYHFETHAGSLCPNPTASDSGFEESGLGDSVSSSALHDVSASLSPEDYLVAIICALPKELMAVRLLFDKLHSDVNVDYTDTNHYVVECIAGHDVVAACLPAGIHGNNSAAKVASHLQRSFRNIKFCLLVGIGGGIPSNKNDVRLGDIVVSHPVGQFTGVTKFDFEKIKHDNVFERTGCLQPPP